MPLKEFWENVHSRLRLTRPYRRISDSLRFDENTIDEALDQSQLWLSLVAVQGYDPNDFPFLSQETREQLSENVVQFLTIAKQVIPRGQPTRDQIESAAPFFRAIVQVLELDRFADFEAYRLGKTLEADPGFPHAEVLDARYRTTLDSNDIPALKMMVYLPDADDEAFLKMARKVDKQIQDLAFELCQPYWPYVSTRVMSDLAELQTVGVDE